MKKLGITLALAGVAGLLQLTAVTAHGEPPLEEFVLKEETTVSAEIFYADVYTERVSFADLNIETPAGMKTLSTRIGAAIEKVCGDNAEIRDFKYRDIEKSCRLQAWSDALGQVDDLIAERKLAAKR